jgi:hypothetical protein
MIEVSPNDRTWQSSITVTMVVIDNGITAPPRVTGCSTDHPGSARRELIFADDFETEGASPAAPVPLSRFPQRSETTHSGGQTLPTSGVARPIPA